MSTNQKTAKNKADRLFSQLIRSRGYCERCAATTNLQTSHIVSRRFAWTRTFEGNAMCLCASCHRWWHDHPTLTWQFAASVIGVEALEDVHRRSLRRDKFDWVAEVERLKEVANENVA